MLAFILVGVILHYNTYKVTRKNRTNLDKTMIRLKPQSRFYVSNRAALLTALVLVFSSFTGFSSNQDFDQQYLDNSEAVVAQSGENPDESVSKSRKKNISLLLFGRG